MKAVFAFLVAIVFPMGVWMACMVQLHPPSTPSSYAGIEVYTLPGGTQGVHWVSGVVRFINPRTGIVLLQTEKGPIQLFASPVVLLSLTEGKRVSAYIAADELAPTVTI